MARALASRGAEAEMGPAELEDLALKLNPFVGYWDPLKLGSSELYYKNNIPDNEATVGFLRHAEIKHGRVAMAAFVGYCLQSNGIVFPWKLTGDISFSDIAAAGSPPDQWDALPTAAKVQILIFIGFLETWSETPNVLAADGNAHYMRGGIPGKFPAFSAEGNIRPLDFPGFRTGAWLPHPVPLNLYDPFGLNKKKSREQLDKSLLAEINNGRLAQLGIMAFLAEQKVPGAVPALKGLVPSYYGEIMAPFTEADSSLPFVAGMAADNPVKNIMDSSPYLGFLGNVNWPQ